MSVAEKATMAAINKIVVLYDGTWCGRETNTTTNIAILSRMMGIDLNTEAAELHRDNFHAKYFDGVGLGGDFINYLWNGAFATHAKEECTRVYTFIVENFEWNDTVHTEIWMFGISRGAYIVRTVGGMINNCGIVKNEQNGSLVGQVYDIYRSRQPVNHPSSDEMRRFRERASHLVQSPIKFMGLFDTVGSRGVPNLNYHTGTGFEWIEFYNDCISTAVENVYQALAIHDRLWAFQPCLALRDSKYNDENPLPATHRIRQMWFPGCHYDLARQEFQFLREEGSLWERVLFRIFEFFTDTIHPNMVISDLVLLWMLQSIEEVEQGALVTENMNGVAASLAGAISHIQGRISMSSTGSGDIYENLLSYVPGGKIFLTPLGLWRKLNKSAYEILFKTVDRVIPDPGIHNDIDSASLNEVYNYKVTDPNIRGEEIRTLAGVQDSRYPSRTYEEFRIYERTLGLQPPR